MRPPYRIKLFKSEYNATCVDLLKSTWQPFHFCAFAGEKLVLFPFTSSKLINWYLQRATGENSGTGLLTALLVFLKYIVFKAYTPVKYILCLRLTTKQGEEVCFQIHALCPKSPVGQQAVHACPLGSSPKAAQAALDNPNRDS